MSLSAVKKIFEQFTEVRRDTEHAVGEYISVLDGNGVDLADGQGYCPCPVAEGVVQRKFVAEISG